MNFRSVVLAVGAIAGVAIVASQLKKVIGRSSSHKLSGDESVRLRAALNEAFEASCMAFEIAPGDTASDSAERVSRANEAATTFSRVVNTVTPRLGMLSEECATLVQLLNNVQIQIMAFAINRKNRGETDEINFEAESAGRKAFLLDAQPLFDHLSSVLSKNVVI